MRKLSPWQLFIIVTIVLITLVLVLTIKIETHKKWEHNDIKYLLNDAQYTTAETLLKQSGHDAVTLGNWKEFSSALDRDDSDQLLIILHQNLRTQKAQDQLLDWVAQGNHLVVPTEGIPLTLSTIMQGKINEDKDDENDSENKEQRAKLPLTARLGVVFAKPNAYNCQKNIVDLVDEDSSTCQRGRQEDEKKRLGAQIIAQRDAITVSAVNLDNQPPNTLCLDSLNARLKAWGQETVKRKNPIPALEQILPEPNMTIGQIKTLIKDSAGNSKDSWIIGAERENLVSCTEQMVEITLPEKKDIHIYPHSVDDRPLVYLGEQTPIFEGKNARGTQIIRIPYKKGTITVFAQNSKHFWANPDLPTHDTNSIRQFDHAYLLSYLAQEKENVYLLPLAMDYQTEPPRLSLIKMLYTKTPEFLVCLILFLTLFIWMKAYRNGPILAKFDISRRNLLEHFKTQGAFLRRYQNPGELIQQLQEAVKNKAKQRIHNLDALPLEQQKQELMRITGLKESEFSRLFITPDERIGPLELVNYVNALRKIRNRL